MANTPVHEMSREVKNLLVRAKDSGEEPLFVDAVQEELGLGHGDVQSILGQLREQGIASEVEPGGWTLAEADRPAPASSDGDGAGRVLVSVSDGADVEADLAEADAASELGELSVFPTVRLPRSVANRLDEAALGNIVKAALEDVPDGMPFLMEIG